MSVDVEWDRKKLWHDAVVGDQGGQAPVQLQEALKYRKTETVLVKGWNILELLQRCC